MNDILNWDEYFILQAQLASLKSKDPSTKVGCVLVGEGNTILSVGFNGFPRGVDETIKERWERPDKYNWIAHAEKNSIYNAARHGIRLVGAKAYLNFEPGAICADCAIALIQAGIKEVIGPDRLFTGKGAGINYSISHQGIMFKECGIIQRIYPLSEEVKKTWNM